MKLAVEPGVQPAVEPAFVSESKQVIPARQWLRGATFTQRLTRGSDNVYAFRQRTCATIGVRRLRRLNTEMPPSTDEKPPVLTPRSLKSLISRQISDKTESGDVLERVLPFQTGR